MRVPARLPADLVDHVDEGLGCAEIVVVAVDAGDHGVSETELRDCVSDSSRLVTIDRFWTAFGDGAEAAAARTEIAEHHEGRCLLVPALADVGALRALADGVQVELASHLLQRVEGFPTGSASLEPLGFADRNLGCEVDLDEFRGSDCRGHSS